MHYLKYHLSPIAIILIFTILVSIGGLHCSRNTKEGLFRNVTRPADYLELRTDNSFLLKENYNIPTGIYKSANVGKYDIRENVITLTVNDGRAFSGQVKDDTILFNNGSVWIVWNEGKTGEMYEKFYKEDLQKFVNEAAQKEHLLRIKDNVYIDLSNIATVAQQYYHRPKPNGGGNSFAGFTLPSSLGKTNSGSYSVKQITQELIVFVGTSLEKRADGNYVQVEITVTPNASPSFK